MDKSLIISEMKNKLHLQSDAELANLLGISRTTIAAWRKRNTLDYELIVAKCDNINGHFLLTGKPPVLLNDTDNYKLLNEVEVLKSRLEDKEKLIFFLEKEIADLKRDTETNSETMGTQAKLKTNKNSSAQLVK